jgi:type IV pilus assembly protein PilZ
VATNTPFEVGAQVDMRFAPGGAMEPFSLPGRVQWVNKSSALRQSKNEGMGIQFVNLSPEDRERLVEVIHTIAYLRDSAN